MYCWSKYLLLYVLYVQGPTTLFTVGPKTCYFMFCGFKDLQLYVLEVQTNRHVSSMPRERLPTSLQMDTRAIQPPYLINHPRFFYETHMHNFL